MRSSGPTFPISRRRSRHQPPSSSTRSRLSIRPSAISSRAPSIGSGTTRSRPLARSVSPSAPCIAASRSSVWSSSAVNRRPSILSRRGGVPATTLVQLLDFKATTVSGTEPALSEEHEFPESRWTTLDPRRRRRRGLGAVRRELPAPGAAPRVPHRARTRGHAAHREISPRPRGRRRESPRHARRRPRPQAPRIEPGLPVVITTVTTARATEVQARQLGILQYIHKPIDLQRLDRVVSRIFRPESEAVPRVAVASNGPAGP